MDGPRRTTRLRLGLAAPGLAAACALAAAVATAQTPDSGYMLPATAPAPQKAAPDPGRSAVIRLVSGRVTYRPVGVSRSRRLVEGARIELRFGARIDARRGRVAVTIARNRSGGTSTAQFYEGVFRLTEQQTESPYRMTLTLAGTSYAEACEDASAAGARTAARRRSSKRVRRLWGNGKGRFRTRGRYSAATVRGTWWLTEDRCDGTLTRVRAGEVIVEDFTVEEPEAFTGPSPQTGGGQDGAQTPAAAPAPGGRAPKRRHVRVRKGGSYTASPKS